MTELELNKGLRDFFETRDCKCIVLVDDLLELYHVKDIAKGLFDKYKILPISWREELLKLKKQNKKSMKWLNNQIKYLDPNTTFNFHRDQTVKFKEKQKNSHEEVIDELIQKMLNQNSLYKEFRKLYMNEIDMIYHGKLGKDALIALRLTKSQIEYLFYETLTPFFEAIDLFTIKLQTLYLVPALPKTTGGRVEHLAKLMTEDFQPLAALYADYMFRHTTVIKPLFTQLHMGLKEERQSRLMTNEGLPLLNFEELFREVCLPVRRLEKQTLEKLFLSPIKVLTDYTLFFGKLRKGLSKEKHPALEAIKACEKTIKRYAKVMDEAAADKSGRGILKLEKLLST